MGDEDRQVDVGGGVEAEFTAFVITNERALRRLAFMICRDWHRAEDIVQTVLIRMFQRWEKIDRKESALLYARRAVANAAVDESRRPWRREQCAQNIADVGPRSDSSYLPEFEGDSCSEIMDALSPRQRAVITLRFIEDVDVVGTARILGISTGTVKSQSARGLAVLRSSVAVEPSKDLRRGRS